MLVLIIIAIVVAIFFFTSKEDDKNLSVKYENKTQPPKQEEKEYDWWEENRTSPPYMVGDVYLRDNDLGMVVSTNDYGNGPQHGIFINLSFIGVSTKFAKKALLEKSGEFDRKGELWQHHNSGWPSVASIEELKIMGLHYNRFMENYKEYVAYLKKRFERCATECPEYATPKERQIGNFLQGKYATKILSSTYTQDGKSVYLYDLKARKSYTISLKDINDESDFAIFSVRKF